MFFCVTKLCTHVRLAAAEENLAIIRNAAVINNSEIFTLRVDSNNAYKTINIILLYDRRHEKWQIICKISLTVDGYVFLLGMNHLRVLSGKPRYRCVVESDCAIMIIIITEWLSELTGYNQSANIVSYYYSKFVVWRWEGSTSVVDLVWLSKSGNTTVIWESHLLLT